jgi:hypothetical protein
MTKLGKLILSCLLLILSTSNLVLIIPVDAQSTSKPSAPKLSIQFPDNNTIQLVIENQEFINSSSVNTLVYYVRVKGNNSNITMLDGTYHLQSSSGTTIITQPAFPILNGSPLDNSTLLDFQVKAVTGYYAVTKKPGPPALISPAPQLWHTEITFNISDTSEWSNPVTVDLTQMATVATNPGPSVQEFPILIILCLTVAVPLITAVYLRKKRKQI